ncbi:MAG: C_GCAxxG_C_C family protein [Anaerolineales bacterium]|nr:C_GCAxxG_C_C family protein [Anaerolineales bacterium]
MKTVNIQPEAVEQVAQEVKALMEKGYHCSEAFYKAVGQHLLGKEFDPKTVALTSGFGGGVGGSNKELCGFLSGGIMVIGALLGREDPDVNDELCYQLSKQYQEKFAAMNGSSCVSIKGNGFGGDGIPCSDYALQVVPVFYETLKQVIS